MNCVINETFVQNYIRSQDFILISQLSKTVIAYVCCGLFAFLEENGVMAWCCGFGYEAPVGPSTADFGLVGFSVRVPSLSTSRTGAPNLQRQT